MFKKGYIPWNKDKKMEPLSEEAKRRIGDKNRNNPACAWSRNKNLSEEHCKNIGKALIGNKNGSSLFFTEEQKQQICNEYFSNERPSTVALAIKYNCNASSIQKIIKQQGFSLRTKKESNKGKKRSEETRQKMRKPKSETSKRKMSESNLLRIQNYPGPYKDTKPELKMKEILTSLNIPFKHQFRVKRIKHNFDFCILNTNILIEVDGDYWHRNPKKFSELNKTQWKIKENDIKNEIGAVNNGFILLRFWEDDILNNEKSLKEKICNVINL